MKGYLLIITSGILFFIIAAVTIIHLMSARALTQHYQLHASYQAVLDHLSIKSIVSYLIDHNAEQIVLPPELSSRYAVSNYVQPNGSVEFSIADTKTNRVGTFNVINNQSQAGLSNVNLSQVSIAPNQLAGVQISASNTTYLVALRTAWYPFFSDHLLTTYSIINNNGDPETITANTTMGVEYELDQPMGATSRMLSLNFSSLSEAGVVSIYLRYSDGSIQNALIEY